MRLAGAGPVGGTQRGRNPLPWPSGQRVGATLASPREGQHIPYVANRTPLLWAEGKLTFVDLLCARARYFNPFF